MIGLHYDEEALIDFLVAPDEVPDREEIEEHLTQCASCREIAESFQQFSLSLSDELVWEREEFTSAFARADESKVRAFSDYAARLAAEQADAADKIEVLISLDSGARKAFLEISPDLWTVGFVQQLCQRIYDLLEQSPTDAVSLSDLVVDLSARIPESSCAPETLHHLRGRAWLEKARALAMVDRHQEALQALDRAEGLYAQGRVSSFDLAIVSYVRAYILRDMDRFTEALGLAQQAEEVFSEFGSLQRVVQSRNLQAAILYKATDVRKAREIWISLVPQAHKDQDLPLLARLFNNLGYACVETGELDSAGSYLMQAVTIFDELGMRTEALRGRWTVGRLMTTSGHLDEAIRRLRHIQEQFEGLEMVQEAGLAALDLVEALLRKDQAEEAAVICRYLVERFTAAGMGPNAITALSYLREALVTGKASPKLAVHVRSFVAELPQRRELLFAPPPSL